MKSPNLNIDLGDLGNNFKKIPLFIDRNRKWVLIFIACMFIGHACYEYYNYIYNPVWSDEKRQNYIEKQEKDTVFNEEDFNTVTSEFEKRKIEYIEGVGKVEKDIFNIQK